MHKNLKHIVIDGCDGIGKTTQIKLLKQHYEKQGHVVLMTRGIGGPVGSEIELLRTFMFQHHFQDKYLEENIFALSEELNLRWIDEQKHIHMKSDKKDKLLVVLQDRGMMSHLAYAQSKGMSITEILDIYLKSTDLFAYLKTNTIVLMPNDIDLIFNRIDVRNDSDKGSHLKFENREFQTQVFDNIKKTLNLAYNVKDNHYYLNNNDYYVVEVSETSQKQDVNKQILEILNNAGVHNEVEI